MGQDLFTVRSQALSGNTGSLPCIKRLEEALILSNTEMDELPETQAKS